MEYDIAPDVLVYAKAGARRGDEEGIYGGIQVSDAATGEASSGSHSFIPYEQDNEAVEAGLRAKLATGPVSHTINLGGNLIWQEDRTAYDFFSPFATNLYDPEQVAPQPTAFAGGDLDDPFPITERKLLSAFLSDTIGLWDERILLTAGARLQSIDIERFSYSGGGLDIAYDEEAITPVVGLVVKPVEGLSLYANYIEALQEGAVATLDPAIANPGEVLPRACPRNTRSAGNSISIPRSSPRWHSTGLNGRARDSRTTARAERVSPMSESRATGTSN